MTITEQLTEIYLTKEWWVTPEEKLPVEVAHLYYDKLYKQGNIITCEKDGVLLGYVEVWKINFEQFGRIICHAQFCADAENIIDGKIAYVANVWIEPQLRSSWVTKILKIKFFKFASDCDYFCGMATRKKTQPVKVFKKSELSTKLFREGVIQ